MKYSRSRKLHQDRFLLNKMESVMDSYGLDEDNYLLDYEAEHISGWNPREIHKKLLAEYKKEQLERRDEEHPCE